MGNQEESPAADRIRLVVFDWAGTTVDFGCFAPVAPFIEAFRAFDITVTNEQAREPMGLHKLDHVRTLCEMPEIAAQWEATHNRPIQHDDVQRIFDSEFIPRQLACVQEYSTLLSGLLDCVAALREREIKIGTTTGYFGEAAELVYQAAAEQGYEPDANFHASDVREARPAPWMIYRNMEATGIYPASAVVKVGDTIPDIGEARNAGTWAVSVTKTGSEVGLTEAEWDALSADAQHEKVAAAEAKLRKAGAHWVIESVAELPWLLDEIESELRAGRRP